MRMPIAARALFSAAFLACLALLTVSNARSAHAEGGPVNVGYLVDENFSFLLTTPDSRNLASGWDIQLNGGNVTYSYNNYLKITDSSSTLPVTMYHKFVTQTAGKVTLEFRFKPLAIVDGLQWQLRSDSTAAVSLSTSGDQLLLNTSSGTVNLGTYAANTEYGVKVVADIDTDKADVYLNGTLKASNANFAAAATKLNGFYTQTGGASTGDLQFTPVKIYKGYAINETFISSMTNLPADWTQTNTGGTIAVALNASATKPDVYSLKLDGSSSSAGVAVAKTVSSETNDQIFQFKTLLPVKADGMSFELKSGSTTAFKLTTSGGQFNYVNGSGSQVPIYNYKANVWYAFKVKVHPSADKADIYMNGKLLAQNAPFASAVAGTDGVRFFAPAGSGKLMWIDDVQLYRDYPLPGDYVPAPAKVASPTYEIGVQSCSMWREGSHLGWDTIQPYPERTPLLGLYDEGNPETADWEIKWQVEHGITFENYCWFRPRGNEGSPIKDPYLGQALHDGYFNAQYSDQMKFTIMWENVSSFLQDPPNSATDFENNLVPYWIEYYFKDPRYLKIDNKPVLSIYSLSELIQDFGSVANVKTEVDYLRTAVKAEGFDDLILLAPYSGTDSATLGKFASAGFDSIYAYSFGTVGSHIGLQEATMTAQKNAGLIDVIATLSMGRDDTAWRGTGGYWNTVTEFNSLASWAKNTFIPSLPAGQIGKKIVMLDNWNEFGEGHFLMPTGLYGFGYLDSLRSTFTSGGSHTDAVPTLTQKNRINVLYPTDRAVNIIWSVPPITGTYSKNWGFDTAGDSEGWTAVKQVSGLTVSGGTYSGTTTGTDPGIVSGDMLNLNAGDASYLEIRMSSTVETTGQIYFITNADPTWKEENSVKFYIGTNSGNQTVYYVPMYENAAWTGTIRQIRFDMSTTSGSGFSIDTVRAVDASGQPTGSNKVVDSSFEDAYPHYSGWQITPQMSNAQYHAGTHSIKLTKTDPYGSLQIPLGIGKNQAVYYSAWAKLAAGTTAGQKLRFGLQYQLDGVQKQVILFTSASLSTTAWTQLSGTYTIKEAGLVSKATLLVYTDGPAVAEPFYLDDLEVKPDLVTDPGFEENSTYYSGWQISQTLSTAEHHTGAQSVKISKSNAYGSLQVPLNIEKGVAYNYSAWGKLAAGSTPGQVLRLGLQYKVDGVQKQVIMTSSASLSASSWTQTTGDYTISESGTVTDVALLVYTDAPALSEEFYLDDLNVRKA